MGLFGRSHSMLLCLVIVVLLLFLLPQFREALSTDNDARALDALLQDYAYRAFVRPRTGVPYDAVPPSNFSGIQIAALRLRSGSLRRKGVSMYKDFSIPIGVVIQPYVERLVLVYQNLGNVSLAYYPLPGYTYLSPVLGLLAYNAANLSATDLPELDIRATGGPITITFPDVKMPPDRSAAKCVWFDLHGFPSFSNVVSGNNCSTDQQGHFSIVVENVASTPAPTSFVPPSEGPSPSGGGKKSSSKVGVILGSLLGGLAVLVLLVFLILWGRKFKKRKDVQQMERESEMGESLKMTSVGETRAPVATVTRTQPNLESEYVT